jgi:hypothetical protein
MSTVTSRRTLLGVGLTAATAAVAIGAARAGGVLDDALRAVGAEPHPEPDPGDTRRIGRAATAQAVLIAAIDTTIGAHPDLEADLRPLRLVADEQLVAVGGRLDATSAGPPPDDPADAVAELARLAVESALGREDDAVATPSSEVARVLASMSAGLSQLAEILGTVRT